MAKPRATRTAISPERAAFINSLVCRAMYDVQRLTKMLGSLGLSAPDVTMTPFTVRDVTVFSVCIDTTVVDTSQLDMYIPDRMTIGGLPDANPNCSNDNGHLADLCRDIQDHINELEQKRQREEAVLTKVRKNLSPDDLEVLRGVKHRI